MLNSNLKVGVVANNMNFFKEIADYLSQIFSVNIFEPNEPRWLRFSPPKFRRLYRLRQIERFMSHNDVCFFEWAGRYLIQATSVRKKSKIVARLHGYEAYTNINKIEWSRVDRLILVSRAMEKIVLDMEPSLSGKSIVIRNYVDFGKFCPTRLELGLPRDNKVVIGTLGYIVPRKRIYDLILQFTKLVRRKTDVTFRLRIAGKPGASASGCPYYSTMVRELPQRLGIEQYVTFDGWVEDRVAWYKGIDVFVSNSYHEATHVAMLEAIASGCYPLAHFWRGAEEFIPRECIFVNGDELVAKILEFASLPVSGRVRLAAQAQRWLLDHYGPDPRKQIADLILEVASS